MDKLPNELRLLIVETFDAVTTLHIVHGENASVQITGIPKDANQNLYSLLNLSLANKDFHTIAAPLLEKLLTAFLKPFLTICRLFDAFKIMFREDLAKDCILLRYVLAIQHINPNFHGWVIRKTAHELPQRFAYRFRMCFCQGCRTDASRSSITQIEGIPKNSQHDEGSRMLCKLKGFSPNAVKLKFLEATREIELSIQAANI